VSPVVVGCEDRSQSLGTNLGFGLQGDSAKFRRQLWLPLKNQLTKSKSFTLPAAWLISCTKHKAAALAVIREDLKILHNFLSICENYCLHGYSDLESKPACKVNSNFAGCRADLKLPLYWSGILRNCLIFINCMQILLNKLIYSGQMVSAREEHWLAKRTFKRVFSLRPTEYKIHPTGVLHRPTGHSSEIARCGFSGSLQPRLSPRLSHNIP